MCNFENNLKIIREHLKNLSDEQIRDRIKLMADIFEDGLKQQNRSAMEGNSVSGKSYQI